jgi:hypothetical protein
MNVDSYRQKKTQHFSFSRWNTETNTEQNLNTSNLNKHFSKTSMRLFAQLLFKLMEMSVTILEIVSFAKMIGNYSIPVLAKETSCQAPELCIPSFVYWLTYETWMNSRNIPWGIDSTTCAK